MKQLVAIELDTRKMTTTGENKGRYHAKIKLTFRRMRSGVKDWDVKRFKTWVYATPEEFEKIMSENNRVHAELIRKRNVLNDKKRKAVEILEKMPTIAPEEFQVLFDCEGSMESIEAVARIAIADLEAEDRIGTAESYQQAVNSVKKNGGHNFADITVKWLKAYQKAMTENGSITTVGIYLRAIRRIFKIAIKKKLVHPELYPFGEGGYQIPSGRQKKKALKVAEKDTVLAYSTSDELARYGADFWMFSYFCNGMNPADIAHLQFKNFEGKEFSFVRQKTRATTREQVPISVHIREEVREIIARRGNKTLNPNAYIFPILEPGLTAKQRKTRIKDFRKQVNAGLKIVSEDLKLPFVLKFGYARHTSSTILKNQGVEVKKISELLGHGSVQTTEIYLGSIESDELEKISGKL